MSNTDAAAIACAVNEGTASFMEYKCINASFPEMSGQALFQKATSPDGEYTPLMSSYCFQVEPSLSCFRHKIQISRNLLLQV